jgi:hypothetical protein
LQQGLNFQKHIGERWRYMSDDMLLIPVMLVMRKGRQSRKVPRVVVTKYDGPIGPLIVVNVHQARHDFLHIQQFTEV